MDVVKEGLRRGVIEVIELGAGSAEAREIGGSHGFRARSQ